ncbi:conjugal transfer protein TraB [Mesorhizobium tianshanense]|uniref:Carbon-nitrogen hydrolase n=1 Tax=Mesorhizobium tianshanense TaxID=39844 RepID=A0A562NLU5_9HYPH|nr:conjugal transfer protein TraB [Mesorhizobium tianshanense]TWI33138.1 carbon-nitrogen hydrolase [Mesorhizobium tianshanense]GLS34990.1 conjugal transfer protein TraB [Mesorhizobium tianshanense]
MVATVLSRPSRAAHSAVGAILVLAATASGLVGWNGNPVHLPAAMFFPALWAMAPNRMLAALAAAGYFLGASHGLPQGVTNFYGADLVLGIGFWVAASLVFVIVHAAAWTRRPGVSKTARYGVAAIVMSVPPFGIVGWAHPIAAAGVLFPGFGWAGLVATAIIVLVMTTSRWPIAVAVLGGLCAWSATTWTPPSLPSGWTGVDTQFRGVAGQYAGYEQQLKTIGLVKSDAAGVKKTVVLPESALGIWTPTVERLWTRELEGTDITVVAGAAIVDRDAYDNVMMEISGRGTRILYRERMPVPVSMWQPWLAWTGEGGGARAHLFVNPVVELRGDRVAPLICYEQLIVWPIIQSLLYSPDLIVATGNGWWTENTNIVAIQKASSQAWARLFGLPLVIAFNI